MDMDTHYCILYTIVVVIGLWFTAIYIYHNVALYMHVCDILCLVHILASVHKQAALGRFPGPPIMACGWGRSTTPCIDFHV